MIVYILCKECVLLSIAGSVHFILMGYRLTAYNIRFPASWLQQCNTPGHEATNPQEYTPLTQDSKERTQKYKKLKIYQIPTLTAYRTQSLYSHLQDRRSLGLGHQGNV